VSHVFRRKEVLIGAATVVVVAALAFFDPGRDGDDTLRRDREVVQAAADRLTYQTISDAWTQNRLGNGAALAAIHDSVELRYLATHDEGDAVILTFQSHNRRCIDLVSRLSANTVETRRTRPPAWCETSTRARTPC
jgi:hypothetical protein